MVYGGGGITPDYIVKAERLGEYAVQLRMKQVYLDFANKYMEAHGAELKKTYGTDSRKFTKEFEITENLLESINAIAKAKGVEFKKEAYEKDIRFVKLLAKATIAKSAYGNTGSSRVTLGDDNQFKKAVSLFPEAERISKSLTSLK